MKKSISMLLAAMMLTGALKAAAAAVPLRFFGFFRQAAMIAAYPARSPLSPVRMVPVRAARSSS